MKGLLIRVDGTLADMEFADDPEDRLTEYQNAVGGWIELIPSNRPGVSAYCNEEGKLKNMAPNFFATQFLNVVYDLIAGDVVVVGPPTPEGEDTDIPENVVSAAKRMAGVPA